jgi:hypothetical protein
MIRFYLYLDCLLLEGLPMMPRSFMPAILRLVCVHRQAKVLDHEHLSVLKKEVYIHTDNSASDYTLWTL